MQIVADHQNGGSGCRPDLFDQPVERRLTGLVEALRRLVQHQHLRVGQQGARQQNTLQLAARQFGHLLLRHLGQARARNRRRRLRLRDPDRQRQEPPHRDRQTGIDRQPLRYIAQPEARSPRDPAPRHRHNPQQRPQQGRFARPVRPENRDDLSGFDGKADAVQHLCPPEPHRNIFRR